MPPTREAITSLPIVPSVLAALDEARAACADADYGFFTPHLLLALLELPDSEVAKCFDETRPGLAERWKGLMHRYQERARAGEFGDYPRFRRFDWDHRGDVWRAKQLALSDDRPVVDDLYLLLGVLTNPRSGTVRQLAEDLGEADYDRLYQITSDRARARDLRHLQ